MARKHGTRGSAAEKEKAGLRAAKVERLLYEARNTTFHTLPDGSRFRVVDYTELLKSFDPGKCGPLTKLLLAGAALP